MGEMIALDLSRAAGPIQVHEDSLRSLSWHSAGSRDFALASLVTDGPKHVVMLAADRDVELPTVVGALSLWWEYSLAVVIRGEITNEWRARVGNAGVYGHQYFRRNDVVIVPPESRQDRYNVRHGPEWKDTSHIVITGGTLLLLAAPGTKPANSLEVDLTGYVGGLEVDIASVRPRPLPRWHADTVLHFEGPEVVAGIYCHHGAHGQRCRHGMFSLHLPSSVKTCPGLSLAGPDEIGPDPVDNSWSMDALLIS